VPYLVPSFRGRISRELQGAGTEGGLARRLGRRAYWDMITHSRQPEGVEVLPTSSLSVDGRDNHAHAALEQTASAGVDVVKCRGEFEKLSGVL